MKTQKKKQMMLFFLVILFFPLFIFGQGKKISGIVTDENGKPLIAASVTVKATSRGSVTDKSGKFHLFASEGETLVISAVNYQTNEVLVGGAADMRISLNATENSLNEVVVVGYGTQKKANLTDAVATVSAKEIQNRSSPNLSSALAGVTPGVYVHQSSGKPGSDGATINIRGIATLSGSSPLIVVDGIISSLDAVNPNDVESISILKDASSAAIYGTLAGNGVVLITTKKGTKGKNVLNYTGLMSLTEPARLPQYLPNYAEYMKLINEGYTNVGQAPKFSSTTIDDWQKADENPSGLNEDGVPNWLAYPNTDWGKVLFSKRSVMSHNLSVSGGSDKVTYLMSLGYLNNEGTIENTGLKRYNLRINLESKLTKFLTIGTQTFGYYENRELGDASAAFTYMGATTPGIVPIYDGKFGYPQAPEEYPNANNVLAWLNHTKGKDIRNRLSSSLYATANIMKGLSFTTRFNYIASETNQNTYPDPQSSETWNFATGKQVGFMPSLSSMTSTYDIAKSYQTTWDNVLNYKTKLGDKHDIGLLLGHSEIYNNTTEVIPVKMGFLDYNLYVFDAVTNPQTISGLETDYGIRSFFGRVNYAFDEKYLLEGNLRMDKVSRFSPEFRTGYFPSFSAGWRISQEGFMENTKSWLTDLKLRASWGRTGNNASGNYTWQSTYGSNPYSFNNQQVPGLAVTAYANNALHWEVMSSSNIGLDASFLNGKFTLGLDYYNRNTTDILARPPMSLTAGTAYAPLTNEFAMKARGFDLNVNYRGKINKVNIQINGNALTMNSDVYKYKGGLEQGFVVDASGNKVYESNLGQVAAISGANAIVEGKQLNEYYIYNVYHGTGTYFNGDGSVDIHGGPKGGMIRTAQDTAWLGAMMRAGYTMLPGNGIAKNKIYFGDLIYDDLNGDGIYGNTYDRKFTGTTNLPKLTLGLTINVSWQGFDVNMIWSGAFGFQYYMNGSYNNGRIAHGYPISQLAIKDRYYYNDQDPADPANNLNGWTPRLKASDSQNGLISDYWMYNASYIKLRNFQLGYSLPNKWLQRAGLEKARIYLSAENPLMFTTFPGLDPEIGTSINYPTMKQYAIGLNLTL